MLTEADVPCRYRGPSVRENVFSCEIHGQCTLDREHSRLRPCITCSDRVEGIIHDPRTYLGDGVESALKMIGVTKERVTAWLGVECGCDERRDKLNQIHAWAIRVVKGKLEKAQEYLDKILDTK